MEAIDLTEEYNEVIELAIKREIAIIEAGRILVNEVVEYLS